MPSPDTGGAPLPRPQTDEAVYLAAILSGLKDVLRAVERLAETRADHGNHTLAGKQVKKPRTRKPPTKPS